VKFYLILQKECKLQRFKLQLNKKMTYQIEIEQSKTVEFLQIVASLRQLGVVISVKEIASFVLPGDSISDVDLENLVRESETQIQQGQFFSAGDIKNFMQSWRQR
jgi:hypothetical protein